MYNPLVLAVLLIHLGAQNGSRETGVARVVAVGGAARVFITVSGEPAGAIQPANIHAGSCNAVERVRYVLTNVRNGKSASTVPASLAALKRGKHVIVLQDSPASLRAAKEYKYVSCGAF